MSRNDELRLKIRELLNAKKTKQAEEFLLNKAMEYNKKIQDNIKTDHDRALYSAKINILNNISKELKGIQNIHDKIKPISKKITDFNSEIATGIDEIITNTKKSIEWYRNFIAKYEIESRYRDVLLNPILSKDSIFYTINTNTLPRLSFIKDIIYLMQNNNLLDTLAFIEKYEHDRFHRFSLNPRGKNGLPYTEIEEKVSTINYQKTPMILDEKFTHIISEIYYTLQKNCNDTYQNSKEKSKNHSEIDFINEFNEAKKNKILDSSHIRGMKNIIIETIKKKKNLIEDNFNIIDKVNSFYDALSDCEDSLLIDIKYNNNSKINFHNLDSV